MYFCRFVYQFFRKTLLLSRIPGVWKTSLSHGGVFLSSLYWPDSGQQIFKRINIDFICFFETHCGPVSLNNGHETSNI